MWSTAALRTRIWVSDLAKSSAGLFMFLTVLRGPVSHLLVSLCVFYHCWNVLEFCFIKSHWVMRCWHDCLSGARCKWFEYGPTDDTAISPTLASLNGEWCCLSGASLLKLSLEKRLLNWVSESHWITPLCLQVLAILSPCFFYFFKIYIFGADI